MRKFNYKFLLALALFTGAGTACDDALDVDPRQSIDASTALTSRENVNAAVVSVYARLKAVSNYGRNLIAFPEALADNGSATRNSGRLFPENINQPYSHFTHWTNSYQAINDINLVLDAIPALNLIPAVTDAEKAQWIGELKFLRGLLYFDLVRAYAYDPGTTVANQDFGGVPISLKGIKSVEEAIATRPARASVADVYTQIYADLNEAIASLGAAGAPYIATKSAAQALLSRVALYNRDYATVVTNATDAFNGSVGQFLSGAEYVSGWRRASNPESIFELRFTIAAENIGVNESLQSSYSTIGTLDNLRTPSGALNTANRAGWGDLIPATALRNLIGMTTSGSGTAMVMVRGNDVRAQLYEVGPGRGAGARLECIKFLGKTGTLYMDNVPVIRKSEMLLNRAEAYATPGSSVFNEALALADLNTLRVARGVSAVELSGSALYEAILTERRAELAFEGHRWFDLKRLGCDVVKASSVPFTDFRILANIPQGEVDGNPNLKQNFNY